MDVISTYSEISLELDNFFCLLFIAGKKKTPGRDGEAKARRTTTETTGNYVFKAFITYTVMKKRIFV